MKINSTKNQLVMFLRLHGALGEFMENLGKGKSFSSISDMCANIQWQHLIAYAFDWSKTKEGKKYWGRLSTLWANSNPVTFCDKPDDYMTPYSVGEVVNHPEYGELIVKEANGCACMGCVFSQSHACVDDGSHGCTPLSRGDKYNVIYVKKS